jgi:hypothetical protein
MVNWLSDSNRLVNSDRASGNRWQLTGMGDRISSALQPAIFGMQPLAVTPLNLDCDPSNL